MVKQELVHEKHDLKTIEKKQTTIYLKTKKEKPPKVFDGIDEVIVIYFIGEEGDGRAKGNNKKTDDEIERRIVALYNNGNGMSMDKVAELTGLSKSTVKRVVDKDK
jgi:DNA invertase Pin-like site-specific DNA recombinase